MKSEHVAAVMLVFVAEVWDEAGSHHWVLGLWWLLSQVPRSVVVAVGVWIWV